MRTGLLNIDNLTADINQQLKVYKNPETGRIDYLALVEKGMENFAISPVKRASRGRSNDRNRSRSNHNDISIMSQPSTMPQAHIFDNHLPRSGSYKRVGVRRDGELVNEEVFNDGRVI
jgi:hypothetical protein